MSNSKKIFIILLLIVFFAITLFVDIYIGQDYSFFELLKKSFNLSSDTDSILLKYLRFPHAVKSVIAGCCLATAGLFMQEISKNPLAEPYITGISSGAGLGITISLLFFEGLNFALFGFAGALISSFLVILFCGLGKVSITKLILIGLSVNMFASSIISFSILTNPDKTYAITYILSGGINENGSIPQMSLFIMFLMTMGISLIFIPKLNLIRLDDNLLPQIKNQKKIYTNLIITTASFLTAISVYTAGILAFIGIIAPLISKILIGKDYRWLFFVNILIGSILILSADFISRAVIYPQVIPLGLVIAFIGSPIFIYFLLKKGDYLNDKN